MHQPILHICLIYIFCEILVLSELRFVLVLRVVVNALSLHPPLNSQPGHSTSSVNCNKPTNFLGTQSRFVKESYFNMLFLPGRHRVNDSDSGQCTPNSTQKLFCIVCVDWQDLGTFTALWYMQNLTKRPNLVYFTQSCVLQHLPCREAQTHQIIILQVVNLKGTFWKMQCVQTKAGNLWICFQGRIWCFPHANMQTYPYARQQLNF